MRQLLLLASLLFTASALADDKLDTKELDKSSTRMSTTTTATDADYNNSRSNNLDGLAPADDDNGDDDNPDTRAQDYNSSRSNTTSAVEEDKAEDACDEGDKDCPDVDEAAEYQDGEDLVLRKRPGR